MDTIIAYNESTFLAEGNKTFDCLFSVEKCRNVERRLSFIHYSRTKKFFV